jgi:hypothetical protein
MSKLTNEIYQKYAHSLGPEQIASPKALRIIENFMDKFIKELGFDANNNVEPNVYTNPLQNSKGAEAGGAVVEIGAGIGTVTDLISTKISNLMPQIPLVCYEVNDFCIEQLNKNVSFKFILIKHAEEIYSCNLGKRKPFLIIDEYITESETKILLDEINPRYIIIEGHRFRQRMAVVKSLFGKSIRIRFFGNSLDSVKGACVISVWSESRNFLSYLAFFRLSLRNTLLARKILQAIGIRKRKFLSIFLG